MFALAVALVQAVSVAVVVAGGDEGVAPVGAYVVLALTAVPLVARRVRPVETWAVIGVCTAVYGVAEWPDPPLYLGGLIAIYTVAAWRPFRTSVLVASFTLAVAVIVWRVDPAETDLNDLLTPLLATSSAWLAGRAVSAQRRTILLLEERAQREATDREEAAERIVTDERLRIARELHDITAHHVSVISVQAEAAAADPATSAASLEIVSSSARTALADLRRMLSVLRSSEEGDPMRPQPGVADLTELLEGVRASGLAVELTVPDQLADLPDDIDLAAYRIAQEALTNVVRHAEAEVARVVVDIGPAAVTVVVEDGGRGVRPGWREGHGLRGIRERVQLYDGELHLGESHLGGLRLEAVLRR